VKEMIQGKESDVGYISSQGKSALGKLREGKDRVTVTVIYSCEMLLYCKNLVLHI